MKSASADFFIDRMIFIYYNNYTNTPEGYMEVVMDCHNCKKTKTRTPEEHKALLNRLNRIEGQIRGIKGMVEDSAYCTDILIQVSAVSAALNAFNRELLSSHIKTCVANGIKEGDDEKIDELVMLLRKLMK